MVSVTNSARPCPVLQTLNASPVKAHVLKIRSGMQSLQHCSMECRAGDCPGMAPQGTAPCGGSPQQARLHHL